MSIRDGHFPNADVAEHVREELAEGERHDQPQIVSPGDVTGILSHAPQIKERA